MKLPRRKFLHLAVGPAAPPTLSRIARAQAYPTRPVRVIVGTTAGGVQVRALPDGYTLLGMAQTGGDDSLRQLRDRAIWPICCRSSRQYGMSRCSAEGMD
jgi:hypothetical protein